MAILIVEEGGRARRFRLKDGRLTIGSGEAATLQLEDPELAEVHANLTVRGEEVLLEFLDEAGGTYELETGEPFPLGAAVLTVQASAAESAPPAARQAAVRPAAAGTEPPASTRPRVQRGGSSSGRTRARSGGASRRQRPAKKSGGPWIMIGVLGALGFGGWKAFDSYAQYAGERGFDLQTSFRRVTASLEEADFNGALREYEKIDAQADIPDDWRAQFDELRLRAEAMKAAASSTQKNSRWTQEYLQPQLQRYEKEYLKGTPQREKVRVFLKRAQVFKENCPDHPEMDWVDRMVERYSRVVSLDDPPTYEDIAFETESLTWAKPRDYKKAFQILGDFIDGASGDDRARALSLFDELSEARQVHFEDRLAQAKYDYDKGRQGEAISWLSLLVVYIGDEDMADNAAGRLVQMPDIDAYLRGYAQSQPEVWERLSAHPKVAAKARELGL